MEIRARYLLIGLFVLAIVAAGAGFVFWLNNSGGLGQRTEYRVRFEGSVAGLGRGSAVQFNGMTVGEVTDIRLVPDRPSEVMATIAVDAGTPLRADTSVGLDFRGLSGAATVAFNGGAGAALPAAAPDGGPPILVADSARLKDLTQSARDVLARLDKVIAENADPLRDAIASIDTFAAALSRNSDKVDGIVKGLANLTGSGEPKAPPVLYDLAAPKSFAPIGTLPENQLAVPTPTAVVALDTQRILQQSAEGVSPAFEGSQWADNTPLLVQSRIVQSFENAGYLRAAAPADGFTADRQLLLDIHRFRLATTPGPAGDVEIAARVVDGDGIVLDARIFSASAPAAAADAPAAVAAVTAAFDQVAADLVVWTLEVLRSHGSAPEAPAVANP